MRLLTLAAVAVLLAACQPASGASAPGSSAPAIRGYVFSKAKTGNGLIVIPDTSTAKTLIYDSRAWLNCKTGEHYPECKK